MTTWFHDAPKLTMTPVQPVRVTWQCPQENCDGQMIYNGNMWPSNPEGYHHTCSKCGISLAMPGQCYPSIQFVDNDQLLELRKDDD